MVLDPKVKRNAEPGVESDASRDSVHLSTRSPVGPSSPRKIAEPHDPEQAIKDDRFSENRVGLDHLSFLVDTRQDLERAQQLFSEAGVRHAEIKDIPDFGITVMMFWDPDNIQLELTAPLE